MTKQEFDAILKIILVFSVSFAMLSVLNGAVTLFMVIGALAITYIFIHYWQKRYYIKQNGKEKVK